jgi:hypothetical protein
MLLSGLVGCISGTELSLNVINTRGEYFIIWLMPKYSIFLGSDVINVSKSSVVSGMYALKGTHLGRK